MVISVASHCIHRHHIHSKGEDYTRMKAMEIDLSSFLDDLASIPVFLRGMSCSFCFAHFQHDFCPATLSPSPVTSTTRGSWLMNFHSLAMPCLLPGEVKLLTSCSNVVSETLNNSFFPFPGTETLWIACWKQILLLSHWYLPHDFQKSPKREPVNNCYVFTPKDRTLCSD